MSLMVLVPSLQQDICKASCRWPSCKAVYEGNIKGHSDAAVDKSVIMQGV